jgi:hypothetical protein
MARWLQPSEQIRRSTLKTFEEHSPAPSDQGQLCTVHKIREAFPSREILVESFVRCMAKVPSIAEYYITSNLSTLALELTKFS